MGSALANPDFVARGGVWVIAQFALMLAVIGLGPGFSSSGAHPVLVTAGFGLLIVGGYFGISGVRDLGRNRTPFPRPIPESNLVQQGIYARVRHPLYTSVVLVALGWAAVWRSWPAGVVALALFPLLRAKAKREEKWLRERFPDYADYAQRVPAFLPRLGPRSSSL